MICRVASCWAVLGDRQFLRGYALLLPDPVVPSLNSLGEAGRSRFLLDMASLGDALLRVTCASRINYEILGNAEPALHAHLFPRYASEPAEQVGRPVWAYDRATRDSVPFDAGRDAPLIDAIRRELLAMGTVTEGRR